MQLLVPGGIGNRFIRFTKQLWIYRKPCELGISLITEGLDYHIDEYGKQSWQTAGSYSALGRIFFIQGNFDESVQNYRKSHDIYENALGQDHS